ncbi:MAG: carboxylesterase/lipase family protein [Candidatus Thorarchaeota archaeon]
MVIISTNKGRIRGVQEKNHQYFLGIPFAKPPKDNLRFLEPQPMDPWVEIKDATNFGYIAYQNHKDITPIKQTESEDCLYLNIWTPNADGAARPVMFYIHGGGFLIGAGSRPRLNGARLASYGDVVVVTFNYRLGVLGFLDLPNIPPNLGIQDQIAALKWVRDNIKAFGGDPNNITIFGESSGSESVVILLSIPSVKGLFHKAIMQSGVANPKSYKKNRARKGAKELLLELDIDNNDIDTLREFPISKFMRIQKKIAGTITDGKENPFRPFVDGKIIPGIPFEIIQKGNASKVPLILGWNEEELGYFGNYIKQADEKRKKIILGAIKSQIRNRGINDETLDNLVKIYKPVMEIKYPGVPYKYLDAILADVMFGIPTIHQIEVHLKHQSDVFCYIFTYKSSKYGGAYHSFEIPFVFGTIKTAEMPEGALDSIGKAEKVSKTMMDSWVSFARTGNPNHKGLPEWPSYNVNQRAIMMLGVDSKVEYDPMGSLRNVWNDII